MPYNKQYGSKTAHSDVVRNPDVQAFLKQCQPLREPSESESKELVSCFVDPPTGNPDDSLKYVIASDGSFYTSIIDKRLPSIQVCYLKFSTILIDMEEYLGLEDAKTHMIDPFKVAAMQRNHEPLPLVLPLANFKLPEDDCVKSTFRRQMDAFLRSEQTCFIADDTATSLMSTLIELALLRPDSNAPPGRIKVHQCPSAGCTNRNIYLDPDNSDHQCSVCGKPLFISDCLRLWEGVSDFHANQEPASRFMSYIEHLIPIHYLRFLEVEDPALLGELAILVDGPLAVFGNAAWLHQSIMKYIYHLKKRQWAAHKRAPIIIGLQKSGYVVEYMQLLSHHIPNDRIFSITDDFRIEYLGVEKSGNGFGDETYYGQDFVYKSPSDRLFVFALAYPFPTKRAVPNFQLEKVKIERYPELSVVLNLIMQLETELFHDALVPIALAHKFASISFKPGGRVLDILGRKARK